MEVNFPRGGGDSAKRRCLHFLRGKDRLFNIPRINRNTNNYWMSTTRNVAGHAAGEEVKGPRMSGIHPIRQENLFNGMVLMGFVSDFFNNEVRIELPNNMIGKVSVIDVSDSYTEVLKKCVQEYDENIKSPSVLTNVFRLGTAVLCKVKSIDRKGYAVNLTLNPKEVNNELFQLNLYAGMVLTGAIESIEDHGYVVDIGMKKSKGFLTFEKAQKYVDRINQGNCLVVGQIVVCSVSIKEKSLKRNTSRVIQLDVNPRRIDLEENLSILRKNQSLHPGSVVVAKISKIFNDGLCIQSPNFTGFVHFNKKIEQFRSNAGRFSIGQEVVGRVLYKCPVSMIYFVGISSHVYSLCYSAKSFSDIKVKKFVSGAQVLDISKFDVILRLKNEILGHCLKTKYVRNILNGIKVGSFVCCFVVSFNYFYEFFIIRLQCPKFTKHNIFIGKFMTGKVIANIGHSVEIYFCERIKGFIPLDHVADDFESDVSEDYALGKFVSCRVLNVKENVLTLTARPSLMDPELPLLTSYDNAVSGAVGVGWILSITPPLHVQFFGDVSGFVPPYKMIGMDLRSFKINQMVKCDVLYFDSDTKQLWVAIKDLDQMNIDGITVNKDKEYGDESERKIVDTAMDTKEMVELPMSASKEVDSVDTSKKETLSSIKKETDLCVAKNGNVEQSLIHSEVGCGVSTHDRKEKSPSTENIIDSVKRCTEISKEVTGSCELVTTKKRKRDKSKVLDGVEKNSQEIDTEAVDPPLKIKNKTDRNSKKKRLKVAGEVDDQELKRSRISGIRLITIEDLVDGMVLMGFVFKVLETEILIELPNNLIGKVSVIDVSDSYTEVLKKCVQEYDENMESPSVLKNVFHPGTAVLCKVKSNVDDTCTRINYGGVNIKPVDLTLNPKDVNMELVQINPYAGMVLTGAVESIEDHGYIIDIGIKQSKGLLKFKKAQKYIDRVNQGKHLVVGQIILCSVSMKEKSVQWDLLRPIKLNIKPKCIDLEKNLSILRKNKSLHPGSVVVAKISKIFDDGLYIESPNFTGFVHFNEKLQQFRSNAGRFSINQEVVGRVLYKCPFSEIYFVGISSQVYSFGYSDEVLPVIKLNKFVRSAKVLGVSEVGVVLRLKNGILGYANTVVPNVKEINVGSDVSCFVVDFNYFFDFAVISCILPNFTIDEISVGSFVTGVIIYHSDSGDVNVLLGNKVKGLILPGHTGDDFSSAVLIDSGCGKLINCRVLSVCANTNSVVLTRNPALMDPELPVLSSYADAIPGVLCVGYILSFKPLLCVEFFGDVIGVVESCKIIEMAERFLKKGQTVVCEVLDCNPHKRQLTVTIKMDTSIEKKETVEVCQEYSVATNKNAEV